MKEKLSQRRLWSLCLGAGIFFGISACLDTVVLRRQIIRDPTLYAMIGGLILLMLTFLLGKVLGPRLDPNFHGYDIRLAKNPWVIAAGFFGTGLTVFHLTLLEELADPSVIVSAEQSVALFLLGVDVLLIRGYEWLRTQLFGIPSSDHRIVQRRVWRYALQILGGAVLINTKHPAFWLAYDFQTLLTLFSLVLVLTGYVKVRHAGLRESGTDQVNFRLWWLFWLVIFVWVYGLTFGRHSLGSVFAKVTLIPIPGVVILLLAMLAAFRAFALELTARLLTDRKDAWLVSALVSMGTLVVFLVTVGAILAGLWLGPNAYLFGPEAFAEIPKGGAVWILRAVGALLIWHGAREIGRL